jgi:hypothetical protein
MQHVEFIVNSTELSAVLPVLTVAHLSFQLRRRNFGLSNHVNFRTFSWYVHDLPSLSQAWFKY